jgi:spore coat protein U-like protein
VRKILVLWLGFCSASHAATCQLQVPALAFGSYQPMQSQPLDATANLRVLCSSPTVETVVYSLRVDAGSVNTFSPRTLQDAGERLNYNLFTDPNRSQVWGDGSAGTGVVNGSLNLSGANVQSSQSHAIYGRIAGGQSPAAGSYGDVLMVVVEY